MTALTHEGSAERKALCGWGADCCGCSRRRHFDAEWALVDGRRDRGGGRGRAQRLRSELRQRWNAHFLLGVLLGLVVVQVIARMTTVAACITLTVGVFLDALALLHVGQRVLFLFGSGNGRFCTTAAALNVRGQWRRNS